MEITSSRVPFSYRTVIATKSRIDKGLLAIPVSLIDLFPQASGYVYLLSQAGRWVRKSFTAYDSSSKECRIGGMRAFYGTHDIQSGDELVLYVLGNSRYQILSEKLFHRTVLDLESGFDNAATQLDLDAAIRGLAALTHTGPVEVIRSEYNRLANLEAAERQVKTRKDAQTREHIPLHLRKILTSLYSGRCQVSGFSFLTKAGEPYFEVHHIDPRRGHHPKNLLVVSPNVHAQFTYAAVEQSFDEYGWLREVKFNDRSHAVFQIVDQLPTSYQKEVHYV